MSVRSKIAVATVAGMAAMAFVSCLKDESRRYSLQECYGIVEGVGQNLNIVADEGDTLYVRENRDPGFELKDGLRVRANFTVLERKREYVCDVEVHAFGELLTKDPVRLSGLDAAQQDSIGIDPIDIWGAWFGGGRYLNVVFRMRYTSPVSKHFVNLVVDEENSTDEQAVVTLRHNAFGDGTLSQGYGRISFDISSLLPEGKDEITIVLKWNDYDGIAHSDLGIFKRKDTFPSSAVVSGETMTEPTAMSVTVR